MATGPTQRQRRETPREDVSVLCTPPPTQSQAPNVNESTSQRLLLPGAHCGPAEVSGGAAGRGCSCLTRSARGAARGSCSSLERPLQSSISKFQSAAASDSTLPYPHRPPSLSSVQPGPRPSPGQRHRPHREASVKPQERTPAGTSAGGRKRSEHRRGWCRGPRALM